MVEWFTATAGSGSMVLAVPVALVAGLVSFFSPCVLPLLPGYLSYATGLSGADLAEAGRGEGPTRRGRMLLGSLLFVLGFSVVFVFFGAMSSELRQWLLLNRRLVSVVLGCLAVLLGLVFMGALPLFQRDVRVHRVPAVGLAAAPALGLLFAVGWTPCIGPTLGVILTLAATQNTERAALLLACYSLGLGVPFVLAGLLWHRALGAVGWVRRHQQWVTRGGGVLLVCVGVLLLSGLWDQAIQWLQVHLVDGTTTPV